MNTTMRCRRYAVLAHTQALVLLCSAAAPAPAPAQAAFRQEPGKSIGTVTTEGDLIVLTLNEGALGAASLFDLDHRTVRFTVGGQTYSQPLDILADPTIPSSRADLAASTAMQLRIRDDMNAAVDMINRLEVMRRQVEDQRASHATDSGVERSLAALDARMLDVELRLLSRTDLHSDDKWYVEPYKVYMNLIWLSGEVGSGAGDVAGGADYRPTDASVAVLAEIERDLAAAKSAFTTLMQQVVPAFNGAMKGKLPAIADR